MPCPIGFTPGRVRACRIRRRSRRVLGHRQDQASLPLAGGVDAFLGHRAVAGRALPGRTSGRGGHDQGKGGDGQSCCGGADPQRESRRAEECAEHVPDGEHPVEGRHDGSLIVALDLDRSGQADVEIVVHGRESDVEGTSDLIRRVAEGMRGATAQAIELP